MPSSFPILTLKAGNEVHLKNRHHSIFKNAVQTFPDCEDGSIVRVEDSRKAFLCFATLNRKAYICGRVISFEEGEPMAIIRKNIERAIDLRRRLVMAADTTAFRLINAEGDLIPGLIVDQYGSVVVIQLTTLGMDKLRPWIVDMLFGLLKPSAIFEKSTSSARKKEGLNDREGWLKGKVEGKIQIQERGIKYFIDLAGSQKTGFFLDQREMRTLVRSMAKGRTVLDVCSYVGGFSVNALLGGAKTADAIDYDAAAIARAREHVALNKLPAALFGAYKEDAFLFLRKIPLPRTYDFIILDPPAFAKRSSDLEQAKHAYTDLNRLAFMALPPGGLLLTCSCSYQMDPTLFQTVVFHAARQAKREVKILGRHRHALDHPVNLYHPEADYLKSLLLWVE